MRTHVNFTRVTKIEMMYERPHVNVKVERDSTFTFTRYLRYIASILFRGRPFDFWGVVSVISEKIPCSRNASKKTLKRKYVPYSGLLCTSEIRLSRNFFVQTPVNFTRVNKIEAIERLDITLTSNGKREFVRCDQVSP